MAQVNKAGLSLEIMNIADLHSENTNSLQQQVLHPGSRKLFSYWEALRAERNCPTRPELNLHQIKDLIPNLFVWEMQQGGSYVYRLAGTGITNMFRMSLTGTDALAGWDPFERSVMSKAFAITQERLQPTLVRMRLFAEYNQIIGAELLALPFSVPGRAQVQLVGGIFPFTNPEELAYSKIVDRQLVTSRTIWTEHLEATAVLADEPVPVSARHAPFRVIQGGRS
jgi:hypothetical protein